MCSTYLPLPAKKHLEVILPKPKKIYTENILIFGKHTPKEHQPNLFTKILSIFGIIFLVGFSFWFLTSI